MVDLDAFMWPRTRGGEVTVGEEAEALVVHESAAFRFEKE